ncbi:CMP-N-acetylneuraminate-beta-galactosamide-alpha-2,3-sialyltransferase 2-like [Cyclopterus lumpus]|uniref:CMP-N-acetylneuraminate-beta-galactosamide- alpha-2,3-sialyltransferase 2-like n=1 Tax=Cyclopterus lumpus TaxID=8103 RepID=UPI00148606DA|nr:CMP-N-acetylneuraminate-beta-galactosamide-alpha-2,3-sialyltransferase 2-like [Cyclopterus lumpus]
MFQMFPKNAELEASSPDRCRSCAVVANSHNLKGSHYGPLIDFQDFVIRMNRGRTKGFEADVGTRTTHHVMYPESAVNLENNTHLVYFPYKIRDFVWITKALNTSMSMCSVMEQTVMEVGVITGKNSETRGSKLEGILEM